MNNLNEYIIFAFRAIDEPELCAQYLEGHVKVLTDYGIENITTNTETWMLNPHIYCVVTKEQQTNELVGGVRIQIADGITPLPVEEAIGKMDNSIYTKIKHYAINGGIGESCGLWISKKVKSFGISRYLMWASISSANQLNFNTMLGICAGYTLILFGEIGFVVDKSLGDHGDFPYPNDNYIAHVIGILNAATLESSAKKDKEVMISLRENPVQQRIETHKGYTIIVNYSLEYSHVSAIKNRSKLFSLKKKNEP